MNGFIKAIIVIVLLIACWPLGLIALLIPAKK